MANHNDPSLYTFDPSQDQSQDQGQGEAQAQLQAELQGQGQGQGQYQSSDSDNENANGNPRTGRSYYAGDGVHGRARAKPSDVYRALGLTLT